MDNEDHKSWCHQDRPDCCEFGPPTNPKSTAACTPCRESFEAGRSKEKKVNAEALAALKETQQGMERMISMWGHIGLSVGDITHYFASKKVREAIAKLEGDPE